MISVYLLLDCFYNIISYMPAFFRRGDFLNREPPFLCLINNTIGSPDYCESIIF